MNNTHFCPEDGCQLEHLEHIGKYVCLVCGYREIITTEQIDKIK